MGRIFAGVSRVLIWLGSTSRQTYLTTLNGSESLAGNIKCLPSEDSDLWTNPLGHNDHTSRALVNQIMSIVYNLYWERLWIIQEVALARDAGLIFGDTVLGQDYLQVIYFTARENPKPGYRAWIADQSGPNILFSGTHLLDHHPMTQIGLRLWTDEESPVRVTLQELVSTYHWQHCKDPRDYVYGLIGLLDTRPIFQIDYTASKEIVAVQALHHLREEGRDSLLGDDAGLRCESAAALLKALTVTAESWMTFLKGLPAETLKSFRETTFEILFAPFAALKRGQTLAMPVDNSLELVAQLNVSGTLSKYLYQAKRNTPIQVKLLNGRYQQFHVIQALDQQNDTDEVMMWCLLSLSVCLIMCQSSNNRTRLELKHLKHLTAPDRTTQVHEEMVDLEQTVPPALQKALKRELNSCSIGWENLISEARPRAFLRFSILELIHFCEFIAPKQADLTFR